MSNSRPTPELLHFLKRMSFHPGFDYHKLHFDFDKNNQFGKCIAEYEWTSMNLQMKTLFQSDLTLF